MKILKLKLRGAIGIRKGLGVEEVEIDFTQFQTGLIALTGRNGSGKTTIMENLHPYRQMVSRDGSLQSHFYEEALRLFSASMRTYTAAEANLNLSLSNAAKNEYNKQTLIDVGIIPDDKKKSK